GPAATESSALVDGTRLLIIVFESRTVKTNLPHSRSHPSWPSKTLVKPASAYSADKTFKTVRAAFRSPWLRTYLAFASERRRASTLAGASHRILSDSSVARTRRRL